MESESPQGLSGKETRAKGSLAGRIIQSAVVWLALGLVAGGLMLSFLFENAVKRSFDLRLEMLLDHLIGAAEQGPEGMVSLYRSMMDPRFDRPYSGWYWQIAAEGETPFRSRSLWDEELETDFSVSLPQEEYTTMMGPDEQILRVVGRDVRLPGSERPHRFMVAADMTEVQQEISGFNQRLVIWLIVLGAVLIITMTIQVRYGLQPLRRTSKALSAIRSGERQRLEGAFPKEIMPLVREVNALLDHNEAVVERAQKHVGNLAHALKTPLTVLANDAHKEGGPLAAQVTRQVDIMRRHVDHHLTRARAAARGTVIGIRADVMPSVRDLVRVMERIYADRGLTFEVVEENPGLAFRGDRQDLDEILGNVLDNAGKWAKHHVRVTVSAADGSWFHVVVEDDGPGIAEKDWETVFARGQRMDESVPGSGLGLGIVRDLTELCGGDAALGRAALGGLKVTIRLPRAMDSKQE